MTGARVYNGKEWITINDNAAAANSGSTVPVPPAPDGDGTIFVSIPSFRDGNRCAKTLKSLFENAKNPDKVIVGLIEQNAPEDDFCIERYCSLYGKGNFLNRMKIRADTTKVMLKDQGQEKSCPHYNQIRLVAEHNIAAKGPSDARALGRKILGNEEYCLQIDAHMSFIEGWDDTLKEEWKSTQNEFAILSTVPADMARQAEYEGALSGEVPRQCIVRYDGSDIPAYATPADGKVTGLPKPLLSHAWSAAFSFAKCHLEESAPYDPFAPYILGAEQFPRFARFWTRGYDVYTPSKNIVFHDYAENPGGHGKKEWMKNRRERLRQESLARFRSFLQIGNGDHSAKSLANLGLYGLGKRRSLQQMMDFVGIDLTKQLGNRQNTKCADHTWVPYDTKISPIENLYSNPDDLDPQPEYPLRTKPVYYQQPRKVVQEIPLQFAADMGQIDQRKMEVQQQPHGMASTGAPVNLLWFLWIVGLVAWCFVFVGKGGQQQIKRRRKGLSGKDV